MSTNEQSRDTLIQERMCLMRSKEAQEKEAAERLATEKLEALRRSIDIASIDWEAEVRLGFENITKAQLQQLLSEPYRGFRNHLIQPQLTDRFDVMNMLRNIRHGQNESSIPSWYSLVNERARLRIRILSQLFHAFQTEALAEAAAEKTRIASEKAAAQAAVQAAWIEENRVKMNTIAAQSLADPNNNVVMHNYTDFKSPETLFAAYKACKRTGRKWLDVRRIMGGQIQAAFVKPSMCDFSSSHGQAPPITVPESWNNHYETGKTPFLTVCPHCKKAPRMYPIIYDNVHIWEGVPNYTWGHVECAEHYKWEPLTNTHYKWKKVPYASAHLIAFQVYPRPDGHWVPWDPKDPDGTAAARAARDKEIAVAEAEIAKLQAMVVQLRKN